MIQAAFRPGLWFFALSAIGLCAMQPPAEDRDRLPVGRLPDGGVLVPTNQVLRPAGKQVTFPGRPVDLTLTENDQVLVVKNRRDLVFIDVSTGRIRQTLYLPGQGPEAFNPNIDLHKPVSPTGKAGGEKYPPGFSVVGIWAEGNKVYASDSQNTLRIAERQAGGDYAWVPGIELLRPLVGGDVFPTGIARRPQAGAAELWVAANRGNSIQRLDLARGVPNLEAAVGVAPYQVLFLNPDRAYVSNWGGDPPGPAEPQALSSHTPVRIDPKTGVASQGTVSVLGRIGDLWFQRKTIPVGLHPAGMAFSPGKSFLYVANANSDTVSVIATSREEVVETILCRPDGSLPFGSGANALAVSPNGGTLYVANGTNNCLAVVRLGRRSSEARTAEPSSRLVGLIPTAWYPGAVALSRDGRRLFVANVKGLGALSQPRPIAQGKNSHDSLGSVSIIDVPEEAELARLTDQVLENNRLAAARAGVLPPRPGQKPVPVPERHGEPSVFQHVIYVIKENRSYDQILGDMKEGNGDPHLVLFGEDVTPNQHALARQFTLFDNFYCSGTLSATGHQWTNEAYVVDYLTKTFGGFTRSYPVDGSDPLAFAASGFLWDNALAHGKSFRNFGEFTRTTYKPANAAWSDVYGDYLRGTKTVKIDVQANVASLAPYTHPHYPGFPLVTPDVYRAALFVEELKAWEQKGQMPNLVYVFLPCDHSAGLQPGFPSPRAMVADNDLALGRIVAAVSRSRFWPRTCIFVVEDDPQFGFDHVDGHRTLCQVVSPYTRRGFVDSNNYNQTGMVKTIELILGLPPMNQLDLTATPMRGCFQAVPDLTPFTAAPNRIPLDEINPPLDQLKGQALFWARKSLELSFAREDEADEETLNRILWHSVRGFDAPYPRR